MKIYVDKYELVTIEHEGKFAVIDPHEDFTRPVFESDVAEAEYTPYPDLEDDGDVLVYESAPEPTFPVKYNETVVGYAKRGYGAEFIVTLTDQRAIEWLSSDPAGISVSL